MLLRVAVGLEFDGQWAADLIDVPGCVGHGFSPRMALANALELAADAFGLGLHEELQFEFSTRGVARVGATRQ